MLKALQIFLPDEFDIRVWEFQTNKLRPKSYRGRICQWQTVAQCTAVECWCERGEEGRLEAWLKGEGRGEAWMEGEGKLPMEGLLHAATRCGRVQISSKTLYKVTNSKLVPKFC